jgi:16S rRNA (cytosine1402-N4)-methyltransferase
MHAAAELAEPAGHVPVLLAEILEFLFPAGPTSAGLFCDATVGLGGHAQAILSASSPGGQLVALDRDPVSLAEATRTLAPFTGRVTLVHTPFSRIRLVLEELGLGALDGILADLGVSSPQLDRGERGFSFRHEGPLDMRMDQSTGETVAELLARISEDELVRILRQYGEERFAGRIARRIFEARDRGELRSTGELAAIVTKASPGRERHKNPATRTFQALRIALNRELEELDQFLDQAASCLRPGGRLCVISFHSLEDRMVKRRFRAWSNDDNEGPRFRILTKHIVMASDAEQERNPRARSAKLRVAERIS